MPKLSVKDLMAIGACPSDPIMAEEETEEYLEAMNPRNFAYPVLNSDSPLDPEDQEVIEGILGIEIRTMYEDADEHEGYYDTIDDAIDALNDMRKLFPHLCRKES